MRRIYKPFMFAFIVINARYLNGDITSLAHHAEGVTEGIAGAIRRYTH